MSSNYTEGLIFFAKIWHTFPTSRCLSSGFFFFFLFLYINKNGFSECVETRSFFSFANNSRSKQNKKYRKHPFADYGK